MTGAMLCVFHAVKTLVNDSKQVLLHRRHSGTKIICIEAMQHLGLLKDFGMQHLLLGILAP